jgi:tripartite-type tricarboxylate transporter receptor subunit TctC
MRLPMICAVLVSAVASASAQDYPTRPINIVVPAAAGGPTDTISRITAQAMSKHLGQQITIENAGGAGGTIGTGRVVRADPDGYTLLIYHVGLSTAATLYRKLPYDTKSAFAPVGLITDAPMTIIGRPERPRSLSAENCSGAAPLFVTVPGDSRSNTRMGRSRQTQMVVLLGHHQSQFPSCLDRSAFAPRSNENHSK